MRKRVFNPGDRIYTRVMLQGRQIAEYAFDYVAGMTELISALRYRMRRFRGLAQVYVRNVTSGWSLQQPLMLYPGRYADMEQETAPAVPERYPNGDRYAQWMEI